MKRIAFSLAVALAALLLWNARCRSRGVAPIVPASDDVEACVERLQTIYDGLAAYEEQHGGPPPRGGVAMLGELIWSGVWEDDAAHAELLTCPGALVGERPSSNVPPEDWFADPGEVGPHTSAYTARDLTRFPLERLRSGGREPEALVACDNESGSNHEGGVTCVLRSDGSVKRYTLAQEIEAGLLPAAAKRLPVGPGSPIRALAVMVGSGTSD
jgi:hypothetical protein